MKSRYLQLLLLLAISLAMGACSEEYYGLLYCPGGLDTLMVYPREEVKQVSVIGDEAGMEGMRSLYLGASEGTRSDILLNFDFSTFQDDYPDFPDSLFDPAKIRSVKLSLKRLPLFSADQDSGQHLGIIYRVHALENSFDPQDYIIEPGPAVSPLGPPLNQDFTELNYDDEPRLHLWEEDLIEWVTNRESIGMVVTAAAGSDSGLVGYSSMDADYYEYLFAPSLVVVFHDRTVGNLLIPPSNDTSTFDQVATLPPDMIQLQTGLRSYPVLTFDIPPLPAESSTYVMYDFRLFADSIDSFWAGDCLSLSQINPQVLEEMTGPVLAADLDAASTKLITICPGDQEGETSNQFTSSRYPDWEPAPPSEMHLLITFSPYGSHYYGKSAELYFTQSTFFGRTAEVEFRPVLFIFTCNGGE